MSEEVMEGQPIKKESKLSASVLLFIGCWLVYACGYIARVNYSAALDTMKDVGVLSGGVAGTVSAVYFIAYAVGQMINGILADKKSPFILIVIGLSVIIASQILMATVYTHEVLFIVWWGINGLGQSMLWAPVFFILSNVLHSKVRFTAVTLISLSTPVGKMGGYLASSLSLLSGYWGTVFVTAGVILAVVLLIFTTLFLVSKKDLIVNKPEKKVVKIENQQSLPLVKILTLSGIMIALPALVCHGLFFNGAIEWIPTILSNNFNQAESMSSLMTMIIPALGACGVFLCNFVYEHWFARNEIKSSLFFMGASLVPLGVMIIFTFSPGSVFGLSAEAIIFVTMYAIVYVFQCCFNHLMIGLVPMRCAMFALGATISGLSNAINYGGSAISTYAMGYAVELMPIWALVLVWMGIIVFACVFVAIAMPKWTKFSKNYGFLGKKI
ncbi:MAG: MFS transporter [Clostridiales bacterium]|nr:MFS transporter [Clostridiales bacterium]